MEQVLPALRDDAATEEAQMKPEHVHRLLRSRETHDYFTGCGWTADPHLAVKYPTQTGALRACTRDALANVELVLCVPGSLTELFATPIR